MSGIRYEGPGGIVLEIDDADFDTPAIVESACGRYTSTYDCAMGEGWIDDAVELTREQYEWLCHYEDEVVEAFNTARAGMPEYQ